MFTQIFYVNLCHVNLIYIDHIIFNGKETLTSEDKEAL